ncbi:MAG: hypothetical protein IPN17_25250 [Deltaproteobacteria bacterium]|nr:hypothetical protein [Deltaproteobacteria bacterium]
MVPSGRGRSATVPLWSLDAANALGREEPPPRQTVARRRDVQIASVPHLTWWNVDLPYETACVGPACAGFPQGATVPNVGGPQRGGLRRLVEAWTEALTAASRQT